MITCKFDELRRKKSLQEGRDLSVRGVSRETGIPPNALGKVSKNDISRMDFGTLNKLCRYFKVKSLCELLEYIPDEDDNGVRADTILDAR